ncbi:MAG: TIGR01777 family protein [Gloeobacteraceae cyanobacterium ES-bin-316]|nr:TIGR01777 family protein [Ferruginibacter sp.]
MKKKIIIAGGTGFIGTELIKYFAKENEVIVLTRGLKNVKTNSYSTKNTDTSISNVVYVIWDAKTEGDWAVHLEDAHLLINLCGKSVNCRYTDKNKQAIFDSRTQPTAALGEAIRKAINPPKLWINASSATIYRHATDRPQDELNGEIENDFSVQVCKRWEKTFFDFRTPFTRKIALRMAITLGSGGVMVPYFNLVKFGLGGRQGNGQQMYSWIHIQDICKIIDWVFEHTEMEGVYNCSSPQPVTNEVFMQTLRKLCGQNIGMPASEWMLKIGTVLLGTESELLLKSRWVLPTRLIQSGYKFEYEKLSHAFSQIIDKTPRKSCHLF